MSGKTTTIMALALVLACAAAWMPGQAATAQNQLGKLDLTVDQILDEVEKVYTSMGFTADFMQAATIKAMDITDTAAGRLSVQYPGKMRWVYERPEPQLIVSDGQHLWIYRPEDNQVLRGEAEAFFGDGKGAGFLSDIRKIRVDFDITLEDIRFGDYYNLKMVPRQKTWDLVRINLLVSKENYHITQVYTYNAYEDVTRIEFANVIFETDLDPSLFRFQIPDNVDILELE